MEVKALVKLIRLIKTNGLKLEDQIQDALESALFQSVEKRNYTYLNDLFLAISKGVQRDAVGRYILAFGNVKPNTDKTSKDVKPFVLDDSKTGDLEGAKAVRWTDYAPQPKSVDRLLDEHKAAKNMITKLLSGEGYKNAADAVILGQHLQAAMVAAEAEIKQRKQVIAAPTE